MSVASRLEELLKRVQRNRERAAEDLEPSPSSIPAQRIQTVGVHAEPASSFDEETGEFDREESRSKRPTIEDAIPQTMYDSKIPSAAWDEAPDTMMDPGGMRLRELHSLHSDTQVYGVAGVRGAPKINEAPKAAPPALSVPHNQPPAHATLQGVPAPHERISTLESPAVGATFGSLFRRALAMRIRDSRK